MRPGKILSLAMSLVFFYELGTYASQCRMLTYINNKYEGEMTT